VQTTLLAAGVSALIVAIPYAFFVMQCLGACYLLFLAYKSFQVRTGTVVSDTTAAESGTVADSGTAADAADSGTAADAADSTESAAAADSAAEAAATERHPEPRSGEGSSPEVSAPASPAGAQSLSARKLYLRGIVMNLTNPKAVLFALSFIPPAVNLNRPMHPTVQIGILGAEFIVATFIVFGSIAVLAGTLRRFLLNSPKANRNLNWFSGVVFLFMAVALFIL
jgi:threonine/homoserine/homoserine lactone efflux protein